jgi:hypothetical protein
VFSMPSAIVPAVSICRLFPGHYTSGAMKPARHAAAEKAVSRRIPVRIPGRILVSRTRPLRTALLLWMFVLPALSVRASAAKDLRNVDLRSELCSLDDQQPNSPAAGVDFLDENSLIVYTVCHVNIALSLRDRFQATDSNHLKAIILDAATGAVKQRFDWPTHGHRSSVRVLHSGQLLLCRDNLLQTLTPEGKVLNSLQILKVRVYDQFLVVTSPAIDAMTVTEITSTPEGSLIAAGTAVLDSRNLQALARWRDAGQVWSLAASESTVVGTSQSRPSQFRPIFLTNSEFAAQTGDYVSLFTSSGELAAKIDRLNGRGTIVSRDGNVLAAVWAPSASFNPETEFSPFGGAGADVYEVAPLRRIASVTFRPTPGPGFDVALSPGGSKLAVIDRLKLTVFAVTP